MTILMKLLRLVVVALVIGVPAVPALARDRSTTMTSQATDTQPKTRTGNAEAGVVWIAAGIAVFVFLAWVAVKMGDHNRRADKIPG